MSKGNQPTKNKTRTQEDELRKSNMMAHLLDALDDGTDVGHYGQLVFAMVARYFLDDHRIVQLLKKQPGMDEEAARVILLQVQERDYNPPKREKILAWQAQQDFPICPDADDPGACNVYKDLQFPQELYDRIGDFWEEKSEAEQAG
jgi:hypothetical protein